MIGKLTAQLERLEPMRVAVVAVTSKSPEDEAVNTLLDWARPQGLLTGPFRLFGYDNCQPHPNHTYTAWLTVGAAVEPSGAITIKDFPGGMFAVMSVQGVEQIGPAWKQLLQWSMDHNYQLGDHPGLEEMLDQPGTLPPSEWRFKLYLSIKVQSIERALMKIE